MSDDRINKALEEFIAGCNERDRRFVEASFPARLLDEDGLVLASCRVRQEEHFPKCYVGYKEGSESLDILQERIPKVLEVWDHPSKDRLPLHSFRLCGQHCHMETE